MSAFTNTALLPVTQAGDRTPTATVKVAHRPDPYRPVVCHETHRCHAHSVSVFTPHSGHTAARGGIAQRLPTRTAMICGASSRAQTFPRPEYLCILRT